VLAVALLAGAHAAAAGEPDARGVLEAQPAELVRRLFDRKVVLEGRSEGASRGARGYVLFEQPLSRTFLLLSQTARQKEYRPELEAIETIERLDDGTVDEHRLKMMFLDIRYRLRTRADAAARTLRWELAPGFDHDLARVDGSWELYALEEGRTLGVFDTVVEVGAGLPSFLQDLVTRKNLPHTLERCRRWVDADGRAGD
jgi:hypothetical protein